MSKLMILQPRRVVAAPVAGLAFYATASAPGNVWIGGYLGNGDSDFDRQWTGAAWANHDTVFGPAFVGGFDLWAGGAAQVWYHSGRAIWQYTGAAWQTDLALTNGSSGFFAGRSAAALYCVVGGTQSGIGILHAYYYDGAAWSGPLSYPVNWPSPSSYNVHGRPSAVTPDGTLYAGVDLQSRGFGALNARFVGYVDAGTVQPGLVLDTDRVLARVWAADDSNVFALTQFTSGGAPEYRVWQGAGTSWAAVSLPTAPAGRLYRWNDVRGVSADDCWVVGEDETTATLTSNAVAAHYQSGTWTVYTIPRPAGGAVLAFNALAVVAADDIWVAADSSAALVAHVPTAWHWDGSSWTERSPFA